ncbi:hypothetical protein L2E82_31923 [Cichorium intybus]|uniref:Uncharacterized protein n=1 Tax=Cichorium intybus TaxID=13427 RepID=A0ACB9BG70_CICIN|nr:hypothetical protein L2E82_31923 [Cichorium intybus]
MCVKTILTNLISESCKVVFEGKVTEIRAKEITGWVPNFVVKDYVLNEKEDAEGEDDVFMNKDGDDLMKDGSLEDDDGESVHVPDSFANDNREGVKTPLDEDPFGLDDLIRKDGVVNNCCSKEMANDISFPPGFTPPLVAREGVVHVDYQQHPHAVPSPVNFSKLSDMRSLQDFESDDEQECGVRREASWQDSVDGMRTKSHVPGRSKNFKEGHQEDDSNSIIGPVDGVFGIQSENADSMSHPKPPVNAVSIMDQFNRFIELGQASGLRMKGCEKDLKIFLKRIGVGNAFK